MKELEEQILNYWGNRAEGYSEYNREELAGEKWPEWIREIKMHLPDREISEIQILDIGTGPGFFAILLAQEGYQVTAIDCTEEITICVAVSVADQSFDLVVSRNLTWVLEEPEEAYREWYRVLKSGGMMLNFDANWYRYLYDEEMRKGYEADRAATAAEQVRDEYVNTDIEAMEEIARNVPLSRELRPQWDEQILQQTGFGTIDIDTDIWQKLWTEDEKINYASTPMFRIAARRGISE